MNKQRITWHCTAHDGLYVIVCQRGDLELFEIIQRDRWARAIDRVMIFKRAIESLKRTMHNVIEFGIE